MGEFHAFRKIPVRYMVFSPRMSLIKTRMMATTNKMCMKPPKVYDVIMPKSHKAIRMMAMVQSISLGLCRLKGFVGFTYKN